MHLLKQSTVATVIVGPVLDSAGAAVTTAVVGDFRLAKEGTSAVLSGATVTHDANGYYLIALTATNTNTVGRLAIYSNNTAQSMGTTRFMVLLPSVYDALVTNATNATGGLPTATAQITALAGAISTFSGGAVASVTGAVGSVTAAVTVGTNNDKTGYSLTAGTGLGNQTANITGNLSGSVGSVTGSVGSVTAGVTVTTNNDKTGYSLTQAFPANFAALGINSSGHVSRVTLVDTTTVNTDMRGTDNALLASSYTAPLTTAGTAEAVWNALLTTYTTAGSFGARILRTDSASAGNGLKVTGAGRGAADIHELQPGVITSAAFAADWLTAAGLAADAVTKIQSGLATASALETLTGYVDTEVAAIKVVTDRISTGLVQDGAVWQFTANMLELSPGGGGAGDASQATLLQVQDTVESIAASLSGVPVTASGRIADGGTITLYCGDDLRVRSGSEITITVSDVGGAIFTRMDGIGTANLFWGASRQGLPASAISGSIASLSQSGSGASQTMTIVVEIDNAGSSLKPAEDYKWQIESQQDHGAETDSVVEMEGTLSLRRRVV